jgi:adenylate kinase
MPELNLVLLGPPGSGKGTQGERLQEDLRLPYFATGDILRAAVRDETELGRLAKEYMDRGDLVPDDVIVGAIAERIDSSEAADGFILDGFPRTVPQAHALDAAMQSAGRRLTAVILVEVPDEELIERLSGRRVCTKSGHTFHVKFDPPKHEGVCDVDGSKLIQRDDDRPETIANRLRVYHDQTAPVVGFYDSDEGPSGAILRRVDGSRDPDEVYRHIRALIATVRMEDTL